MWLTSADGSHCKNSDRENNDDGGGVAAPWLAVTGFEHESSTKKKNNTGSTTDWAPSATAISNNNNSASGRIRSSDDNVNNFISDHGGYSTTRSRDYAGGGGDSAHQNGCCSNRRRPPIICILIWIVIMGVTMYVLIRSHINKKELGQPTEQYPYTILLESEESINVSELKTERHFVSPNGMYQLSIRSNGDLIMRSRQQQQLSSTTENKEEELSSSWNHAVLWQKAGFPKDATRRDIKLSMQGNGNLVLSDRISDVTAWKSLTNNNPDAYFVLDDGGQVSVVDANTGYPLYIDGLPHQFDAPNTSKMREKFTTGNLGPYPIRSIFYYPWFPTTWTSHDGQYLARYIPKLGRYDSGHLETIQSHVKQMDYGNIRLGISSWWGPDTKSDRARLLLMMDESLKLTQGRLKWCVYYEPQTDDDSSEGIRRQLLYLKRWFIDHPSYARSQDGNKPIIFVYNKKSKTSNTQLEDDCKLVKDWHYASNDEWHVVLKLFSGYESCEYYDSVDWHQYGPSKPYHHHQGDYVNISPGFWHASEDTPRLERLTKDEWTTNVQRMSSQKDVKWHLITSFNEAVEGTLIESTDEWKSKSGMGYYLDVLHNN